MQHKLCGQVIGITTEKTAEAVEILYEANVVGYHSAVQIHQMGSFAWQPCVNYHTTTTVCTARSKEVLSPRLQLSLTPAQP